MKNSTKSSTTESKTDGLPTPRSVIHVSTVDWGSGLTRQTTARFHEAEQNYETKTQYELSCCR